MRTSLLALLKKQQGLYLSGQALSQRLSVTRSSVWKHMNILRKMGYPIEAHPRKGYRLLAVPDILCPEEIGPLLTTRNLGRHIHYHKNLSSTNQEAKKLAATGAEHGTVILAESQSGGRGRLSREWHSPAGGLWLSLILRPPFLPIEAPKCTLLASVAITRAVREQCGVAAAIKWPNDILWQNCKIAGILTEMSAEVDAVNYIIVGMGINVNLLPEDFPENLRALTSSLKQACGRDVDCNALAAALLNHWEELYHAACEQGFSQILAEWRALSCTLGQEVRVNSMQETFSGIAQEIDSEGALLVQTTSGLRRVLAGDVSLRPVAKE